MSDENLPPHAFVMEDWRDGVCWCGRGRDAPIHRGQSRKARLLRASPEMDSTFASAAALSNTSVNTFMLNAAQHYMASPEYEREVPESRKEQLQALIQRLSGETP